MLSAELRGADQFIARYGAFEMARVLREPFQRGTVRVTAAMAKYPPQKSGSRYVRTGDLGRRWTVDTSRWSTMVSRSYNNTKYAPLVQRDPSEPKPHQAHMHRDTWQTDVQVLKAEEPTVVKECDEAIFKALEQG